MESLTWPVQQRLKYIEFRLFWEGRISRQNVKKQFGISPQQATKDFNLYQEKAPGNILYSPKLRRYIPSPTFKAKFIQETSTEYLRHIDALRLEHKSASEIWIDDVPSYDCTHMPTRSIKPEVLKSVIFCIRQKKSIEIQYLSLSKNTGSTKRVSPHSIGTDGNRWHVRAYNHEGDRFSDYSMSRISSVGSIADAAKGKDEDVHWNAEVEIQICPEPELSADASEALQIEYQMIDGIGRIKTTKAMLWYVLRRLGFNPTHTEKNRLGQKTMRNESSFRLYLKNIEDVEKWLERR